MFALYRKELRAFLSSLIGYLVIIVFLTTIGLMAWVFPGENNILESGYANIDTLFVLAPWVFLFLIPAVTMRSFADEKKLGTIEFLLTKPLTDLQIIIAKNLAGITLVILSLLPTLVYFYSIYNLGNPPGNIDTGATWGSYFGLLFLASAYVSIGVFASSVTENQIVSFILALFICFIFFIGFESIAAMPFFQGIDDVIIALGMNDHYVSMSRGVIDTRDLVYFLSVSTLFILITKAVLETRKWR